ncbi:DNA-3-methyladenine glycosylase I, partial [Desulfosporosinus sp. SYSU MS00001]|uniref:DNA-3-methyladenine glycosylase I n=1 Tax=Desulfosporosinus sp. SYSU MS00001 TaxID=3416284 RepID=UPI003CECFE5F
DDRRLFEFLCLEGAQAGLSWITILRKRENYRAAFDNFDVEKIALYDEEKVNLLMQDSGIIRNRRKIEAIVQNAKAFIKIQKEYESFDKYIWEFVGGTPKENSWSSLAEVPAKTLESKAMSKELIKRGFKFVGETICYSFMQATGMVNDHITECFRYKELRISK